MINNINNNNNNKTINKPMMKMQLILMTMMKKNLKRIKITIKKKINLINKKRKMVCQI